MNHGNFIWADLSTFDLKQSDQFYADLLGWRLVDAEGYSMCYAGRSEAAGILSLIHI